jgi:fatty acid-binding protein DegV
MMSKEVFPSAVAQCISFKFLISENVKDAEILIRLGAQIDNETLSRIPVYDWSNLVKEGRTVVENLRRLRLLQGTL